MTKKVFYPNFGVKQSIIYPKKERIIICISFGVSVYTHGAFVRLSVCLSVSRLQVMFTTDGVAHTISVAGLLPGYNG